MAVGALVVVFGTAAVVGRGRPAGSVWPAAARSAAQLAVWVAIAGAVSLANALRVRNCDPTAGFVYLALFGFGAIPMVVAAGLVAAHGRSRAQRAALAVGAPAVSLASTLATLALQPAIVAYDSFFGYYAGSIYDESLTSIGPHLVYRLWSVVCSVGIVAALAWARGEGARNGARFVGALVVALGIWTARGELGLARDREYVVNELGGFAQTEHFDVYYDAASFEGRRLELLLYDHEARYADLAAYWGTAPGHRLRSFVYGNADRKGELMGGRRTLVAKIWLGEMHIVWSGLGDTLLGHEMAHLFLRADGAGPLSLSTRAGVVPLMALVEGAATAAAGGGDELDGHAWSAAATRAGVGADIASILGPAGFWGTNNRLAYTLTGSFCAWLVESFGPERFRAAYTHGDFERAYGRSLSELAEEWRGWLDGLSLTEEQLDAARFRFDQPSLFGRVCGRAIATRMDEGVTLWRAGDPVGASRAYEAVAADDPTAVATRLQIAERYADMGRDDEAARHARWITEQGGAGRASVARAAELLADVDWREGRDTLAVAAYAALLEAVPTDGDRRRLEAKVAAIGASSSTPMTAAAVRATLVDRPGPGAAAAAARLTWAAAVEHSPLARYLAALRLGGLEPDPLVVELLDDATLAVLTPAQRRRAERARAEALTAVGDTAAACVAWGSLEADSAPHSEDAADAALWRGRCERGDLPPRPTRAH